jgi:hypothetical protein
MATGSSGLIPAVVPMPGSGRSSPVAAVPGVWAHFTTLGTVAGEQYLGRIVVELFDGRDPPAVAFIGADRQLVERAVAALGGGDVPGPEPAMWPAGSIIVPSEPAAAYRGRIMMEFWQRTVKVTASGSAGNTADLVQRALQALQRVGAR